MVQIYSNLPVGPDHYLDGQSVNQGNVVPPLTVKGGVVNGNFELAPTFVAATSTMQRWIDGTATGLTTVTNAYKWATTQSTSGSGSAQFDNVGGKSCITIVATGIGVGGLLGVATIRTYPSTTINTTDETSLIPVIPNAVYQLTGSYNIQSCSHSTINTIAANYGVTWYQSDGITRISTAGSSNYYGTVLNTWTPISGTITATAPANAAFAVLSLRTVGGSSASSEAMTVSWAGIGFSQTSSITNSSSSQALFYPTVTAVTSTDNIDQSAVTDNGNISLGDNFIAKRAQPVTPTKKNLTGYVFRKAANVGSPTSDVLVSLEADNSNKPSGTPLASVNITAAAWDAIANATDYTVSIPYTLTAGTKYWFVFTPSVMGDASNYRRLDFMTGTPVSYYYQGGTWNADATKSLYFKTLYAKNTTNLTVSTDTDTISVNSSTTDGWQNGDIYSTYGTALAVLTLAPGANNIYFSSNGPSTADGTVDPSLQGIFGGIIIN